MHRVLTVLCLLAMSICSIVSAAESPEPTKQQEIEAIDRKIDDLEQQRNHYKASAARHLDQADRWQFNSELYLETRREYELAEKDLQKIEVIDKQIHELKLRKEELLKASGP
jgi:hypothetical protein